MISIIMPAYNAEKTIKQSMESVIKQTYTDWELIVVDDCSMDSTVKVVEAFIKEYGKYNIRLVKNLENRGVAYSRNRGVDESRGVWMAFLDSDDLWREDKLEKQMCFMKNDETYSCDNKVKLSYGVRSEMESNPKLIFTGSSFITSSGEKLGYIFHVPFRISREELLKQNLISCSSVMVSKELIEKYKFPEKISTIHEDFAVWLRILGEIPFAYGIDEPLLRYRISSDSKSGNKIKATVMNWNTYRYVGLGKMSACYYMIHYCFRGLRKWKNLRRKKS